MNKGLFLIDPNSNIFSYVIAFVPSENLFIRIQMLDFYLEYYAKNTKSIIPTKWVICKENLIFGKSTCVFVDQDFINEFMAQHGDTHDNSHKFTEEFTFVSAQEGIAFFNEFITKKLKEDVQAQEL